MKIGFNIPKGIKKVLSMPQNSRVGRVTGNKRFIFLALDKERTDAFLISHLTVYQHNKLIKKELCF